MIAEFFENSEIFITGGSGAFGKGLIEKLLRSCNVKKIYILLRSKKNVSSEDRLQKLKQEMIFEHLKLLKPDEMDKKLVAIPGDVAEPLLGITRENQKLLQNVSIVFHCAATVRFDEPLRDALKLNVGGTLEAIKLAETLKNLKVFLHVSTFYSNPYLKKVEEKVYKSPMDWKFCLNLLNRKDVSEEQLDVLTRKLIVGFPNTYCFTKNLAESLVNDYRHRLPLAIYRPSVVLFAIEEPEPGYPPSMMNLMGLIVVMGAGIMKSLYMLKHVRLDLTPQDYGVKALCYYTTKTAHLYDNKKLLPSEVPVYNLSSYTHSRITLPELITIAEDYGLWNEAAFEKNLQLPSVYTTESRFIYMMLIFLKQIPISLLADFALILMGLRPALMRAQRKLYCTLEVMKPFLFNNYESNGTTDFKEILKMTSGTDFNMDSALFANDFYWTVGRTKSLVYGVRKYLLKEDPKTLPKSRMVMKITLTLQVYVHKVLLNVKKYNVHGLDFHEVLKSALLDFDLMKIWLYNTVKFLLAVKLFNTTMDYAGYFYNDYLSHDNSTICCNVI